MIICNFLFSFFFSLYCLSHRSLLFSTIIFLLFITFFLGMHSHNSKYLVILTFTISQSISRLYVVSHGISKITSVFFNSHTSTLTHSTCFLKYMLTSTLWVTDHLLLSLSSTFFTLSGLANFSSLKPCFSTSLLFMNKLVAPLSSSVLTDTLLWMSIFSSLTLS